MGKLDVCVVNYNTVDKLKRFLESVNQSNPEQWDLYVADNGSTDGSREFLSENQEKYNITQTLYNDNIGFSRACNQLAALSSNEIIGLFNADVWLMPNHVDYLLYTFDQYNQVHILGPKQRNENGNIVHGGIFGTYSAPKHRGWNELDVNDDLYRDFRRCVTVSGSAYLIRRYVWDVLTQCETYQNHTKANGAFLPTPHYYEETWCSYHAGIHGYQVWYDGRIPSLGHTWHASSTVGGAADQQFPVSQKMFREMCDLHGIPHD